MNFYGVGIDVVNILRFKSIINKNNTFKQRIFSNVEINYCQKRKNINLLFHFLTISPAQ